MKVLVVEDEFLISMLAAMALTDAGHEVVGPVATEAGGLALAHAHRPELAMLDIDLGPGGCGVALARSLHGILGIRSLFVSGNATKARTASDIAFGLLSKPYEIWALIHAITVFASALEGRRLDPLPRGLELFSPPVA